MLIDLQVHSNYSDGYLTPSQLIKFLKDRHVKIAALTDHNTVGGLDEFASAAKKAGIKTINGLELYAKINGKKFNLLWYNFDPSNPELHSLLRESQIRRRRSIRYVLDKLVGQGFKIDTDRILDKYSHYIPINHVINDLAANRANWARITKDLKNRSPREEEIIHHYFFRRNLAALRETYTDLSRIIKLKKKIGGQLVLCHPCKHKVVKKEFVQQILRAGIEGIEVLSPHHSLGAIMYLQSLAREFGAIETGGSDFHRFEGRGYLINHAGQYFTIHSSRLKDINKIIN